MMNLFEGKNVLCISPHPDDVEFGCGGTIHRLIQLGNNVRLLVMSNCEDSLIHNTNKELTVELNSSCKILGIKEIKTFDFQVRNLWKYQTEICNIFYHLNIEGPPDVVFMPSSYDIHQDHSIIYECGSRIFKTTSMLGYELPWNCFNFSPDMYVGLDEENVDVKLNAICQYRTQMHKRYSSSEYTKGTLSFRGQQINKKYAEAFEVIRFVVD